MDIEKIPALLEKFAREFPVIRGHQYEVIEARFANEETRVLLVVRGFSIRPVKTETDLVERIRIGENWDITAEVEIDKLEIELKINSLKWELADETPKVE